MSKPKIAFFDFTSCEGCQLTVVDSLQTHVDLLDAVEIVQFREAMTERGEDYIIAFIEGSCVRKSDEDRLKKIRAQATYVVALGACAHLGGVNAIRNCQSVDKVTEYVYGQSPDWTDPQPYRRLVVRDDLLRVTPLAQPIEAIIPVDVVLPGCPIDPDGEEGDARGVERRGHLLQLDQLRLAERSPLGAAVDHHQCAPAPAGPVQVDRGAALVRQHEVGEARALRGPDAREIAWRQCHGLVSHQPGESAHSPRPAGARTT